MKEQEQKLKVIIGNPPYSVGQKSGNDNNQNERYPDLDQRIKSTYAELGEKGGKKSLYDSYIRALRWASDRLSDQGIVAFVSNGGWLRNQSTAGLRRALVREFSSLYIFDLRGNQNTKDEISRKEGGKIFGSGSRAPVAITFLVKNKNSPERGAVYYYDVGDYKSREEKLEALRQWLGDPLGLPWQRLHLDSFGDWLDKRDATYYQLLALGLQKHKEPRGVFETYALGVNTYRDLWLYSFSLEQLRQRIANFIDFYNRELEAYQKAEVKKAVSDVVRYDPTQFAWSADLFNKVERGIKLELKEQKIVRALYRPFVKEYLYYERDLVGSMGRMVELFPDEVELQRAYRPLNLAICVPSTGNLGFSCLITDVVPDYHLSVKSGCQVFPLYWYEKVEVEEDDLFSSCAPGKVVAGYRRHDAITDVALDKFRRRYPQEVMLLGDKSQAKENIFYYIYGILHCPQYRAQYADTLRKELPYIPYAPDFKAFSQLGRSLAYWHLNYESVEPWPLEEVGDTLNPGPVGVKKMRWGKTPSGEIDYTTLHVTPKLTLTHIPPEAHQYKVDGSSPLKWLVDCYYVRTDNQSKITNDPNLYSTDPRYIVDLAKRLVRVAIESQVLIVSAFGGNDKNL